MIKFWYSKYTPHSELCLRYGIKDNCPACMSIKPKVKRIKKKT